LIKRELDVELSHGRHRLEVTSGAINWIVVWDGKTILRRPGRYTLMIEFPISDGDVTRRADLLVQLAGWAGKFQRIQLQIDGRVIYDA
jgi:hypothetical protein